MVANLAGQFPERTFAAVLSDMDGTLIDSLGAVERSWPQWCEEFGIAPAALAGSDGRTSANTIAVVMADRPEAERVAAHARLAATGLPRPQVVVTASDVSRGKPGPEPYERGAALLGVPVGDCLVIEDATAGLVSGRAAGCGWAGGRAGHHFGRGPVR